MGQNIRLVRTLIGINNQIDQEDETEGLEREGLESIDGEIEEGGCEETFLCLSLT
jgi:hypothetical protein